MLKGGDAEDVVVCCVLENLNTLARRNSMKKHCCIFFTAVFVLGLLMVTINAQATEVEVPKIQLSGLIQVGAVWQNIDYDAAAPETEDHTDLCLTTVELKAKAEINEWVNVAATLLYQDPTFGGDELLPREETSVEMDQATITIGNTEEYPLYCAVGKMYVPFGALLTHFPHADHYPLIDAPLTMVLGETLEKALLVGFEQAGVSVSVYGFNGDMDEFEEDNNIESYGVDANYSMDDEAGFDLLIGASYISNIADSDTITELLHELTIDEVEEYYAGFAAYLRVGLADFFVEGEYMTFLDDVCGDDYPALAALGIPAGYEAKPVVWNVEAGYNLDWGKNLEIVLKYAGSDEAEVGGLPETRYGLCLNQDLFEDVVVSLGYLYDEFDEDEDILGRDSRNLVFAQLAVEF